MANRKTNEALNAYVADVENQESIPKQPAQPESAQEVSQPLFNSTATTVHNTQSQMNQQAPVNRTAEMAREQRLHGRADLPTEEMSGLHYKENLGYLKIPVSSLPTQGLFYPEGTEISIRAARGAEIKHWSTMNEDDLSQLAQTDDILNYIIERCVSVRMPGVLGGNWKDLKDVDRFYLLLAVREFTFLEGENQLMVPISEGKDIPVVKEMIDFIQIPEDIMKHYSPQDRCFIFNIRGGKSFKMYIPSLGVSQWLRNYAQAKASARQGFDTDFILYAPMLINDFRRLSQRAYEEMVSASQSWTVKEWSVVSYVRDSLTRAAEPTIKYQDESGAEVTIPLTFRGGIKSLFTLSSPLADVD